jgi:probable phosphoglycerate mutase
MYFGNLRREYPEDFHKFIFEQPDFKIDDAETYGDVTERAYAALEEIAKANDGKTIAITTHGVTIRCLLCKIGGIDLRDNDKLPIFMNTGVAKLSYDNGRFETIYTNDYSHLSEELQRGMRVPDLRHEFIDPAKESDYYTQCYKNSWMFAHGNLKGYNAKTYLDTAKEHYRQDPESVQRLYYNDEPAGLLDLDVERGSHAGYGWITLLYLEPEYRGKGCGIQLLSRAMLKYEQLGRRTLRLHVAEDNHAALKFYEKCGFKELSSQPGNDCKLILMERKLGGHEYI